MCIRDRSMGNDRELAGLYGTLSLILISILLTGFNVYQRLGQFGGAGSIVPVSYTHLVEYD